METNHKQETEEKDITLKDAFMETVGVIEKNTKLLLEKDNVKKTRRTLGNWINKAGNFVKGEDK